MAILTVVRHGQSEWNLKNLFTGWHDVDLSEQGIVEAKAAGRELRRQGVKYTIAYTSVLLRARRTLELMLAEMDIVDLPIIADKALNERDYGDLTGLNKNDARKRWGDDQVHTWRRSYDIPPPGGESLKDTARRCIPYYNANILPALKRGDNVLVVAHGNSLRSLVMEIENLSPAQVLDYEIATGAPIIFSFADDGRMLSKQIITKSSS